MKRTTPASEYLSKVRKRDYFDEDIMSAFKEGMKYNLINTVWQPISNPPTIKPNDEIIVLTDTEFGYELKSVLSSEFAEFTKYNNCIIWTRLNNIIPKKYQRGNSDDTFWFSLWHKMNRNIGATLCHVVRFPYLCGKIADYDR